MQARLLSVSTKAILLGLFLSKFDKEGLTILGFNGFWEAFNAFAYAIGVKPATIKNYRDEFDPYFQNPRRGWHGRQMKGYCQPVFDEFSALSINEFFGLVKYILASENYPNREFTNSAKESQSESVAKRLITGKSAEEYFKINYRSVPDFSEHAIKDTTLMACGYDFEITENGLRKFCVEVKGLAKHSGTITLTEKEYFVAEELKDEYCLFIVFDFDKKPRHNCYFNPLFNQMHFKRIERQITQVNYTASI
ncbi:protein NO VEIN domain-containing protein [Spirosoma areae]